MLNIVEENPSPVPTATSDRLQALAEDIRSRLKRMASDIYWIGRNLLEAKELFGWGQNEAFLNWAQEQSGIQKTLVYNFINVAKAFPNFQDLGNFEVVVTALYFIARPSIPEAARTEFIARSQAGEIISLPTAKAIVNQYKGISDQQFERVRSRVQFWGELEMISDQPRKLVLTDATGKVFSFRTYAELDKAFEAWQQTVFEASLTRVRGLVAPHWLVRAAPIPKQPFRLEIECIIPGSHKTLFARNPLSLENWWREEGKSLSDRFTTNLPQLEGAETTVKEIVQTTCLNCSWHEIDNPATGEDEFWCGFYRSAFELEQTDTKPNECRKWRPIHALSHSATQPLLKQSEINRQTRSRLEKAFSSVTTSLSPSETTAQPVQTALQTILQELQFLSGEELDQVEQEIQQRRQALGL
ncbi:MAG: hypothetical protein KME10_12225 [Plectolyngbya sp. WJT66-NPBG17]|jgi:hypothetical protein|nr:hypothetical protein [Plectolyngbya sp. WJT66-NPBG17]